MSYSSSEIKSVFEQQLKHQWVNKLSGANEADSKISTP